MRNSLIFLFILVFFVSEIAFSQKIFKQALSNRIASYDITAELDTDKKLIKGKMDLHWKNASKDTLNELQFHMYLNAFKNNKSTLFKESYSNPFKKEKHWGWVDIKSMKIRNGENLLNKIEYIQPDDDNKDDQTVFKVNLKDSLYPDTLIHIEITFETKLPKLYKRSGYSDNYYFVAQWFPKIGVYESAGMRYATKGQWNCHQYHRNSEFYADFGVYNVDITVPQKYIVGATGSLMSEKKNKKNTKTLTYRAEDVIDFAWTASKKFKVVESQWKGVKIRALMQPEHIKQADRHISSAIVALKFFDKNMGKYPYPNLTIVDPAYRGGNSGGMEYPTLITVGTFAMLPEKFRLPQMITIHEFGHQYFMGILASNEFEEAWLDEGLNSYFESRIMDSEYGEKTSGINILGLTLGDFEFQRASYVLHNNPQIAESARNSWEFNHGGYGVMSYNKPAVWLTTLERMIGTPTMDSIMKAYYNKWKFKHPSGQDFINVANEIVKKNHGEKFGKNLNWFFNQVLFENSKCDYKLASIYNVREYEKYGITNNKDKKEYNSIDSKNIAMYKSLVRVHRLGEMKLPVELLVMFDNGEKEFRTWDGKASSHEFVFTGSRKIVWAQIDPYNKNMLDINLLNNSKTTKQEEKPLWRFFVKFLFLIQNVLQSFTVFV